MMLSQVLSSGIRIVIVLGFCPALALGNSGFELGGGLTPPSRQKNTIQFTGLFQSKANLSSAPESLGVHQENVSVRIPVIRTDQNALAFSARYNSMMIYPGNSAAPNLYDIEMAASYTHEIEEKRMWSLGASFGSASDQPFEDSSVSTLSTTAFYSLPSTEISSWLFIVNYSNNRTVLNNIPIPGFAYNYTPSKTFRGIFGIPFAMIYWRFAERWNLSFFSALFVTKTEIAYSVMGPVQVFTGLDLFPRTFLKYGRANDKERLYYDEKKLVLGLRSPVSRILFTQLEGGYSFSRRFFTAESYSDDPTSVTSIEPCWFLRTSITASF